MPQPQQSQPTAGTKKKKGPAPAHQNKFAFRHNPKSKTTERILASPILHVCRRCHDKLEWRKQYRKYKPLTQPGTCNGCHQRNVKAAYHTICEPCTRNSVKAQELFATIIAANAVAASAVKEEDRPPEPSTVTTPPASAATKLRACAICVKELALTNTDDDNDNDDGQDDLAGRTGRLRLRERRAIERKLEKEAKEARKRAARANEPDGEEGEDGDDDDDDAVDDNYSSDDDDDSDKDFVASNDREEEEEDPFLKAVGGADKLLTGKAYQEKLLGDQEKERRRQQQLATA